MTNQAGEGLLSPFLRSQRVDAAAPYLVGEVLDVGCGAGTMAGYVNSNNYVGVDIDAESLVVASRAFPNHRFQSHLPHETGSFDTVISLAVIEHIPDPVAHLKELVKQLKPQSSSRIICTTPHPSMDWIHTFGASVGLFSRQASDEHEKLLDRERLTLTARASGLELKTYKRFLFGANQLAVFHLTGEIL